MKDDRHPMSDVDGVVLVAHPDDLALADLRLPDAKGNAAHLGASVETSVEVPRGEMLLRPLGDAGEERTP